MKPHLPVACVMRPAATRLLLLLPSSGAHDCPLLQPSRAFALRAVRKAEDEWTADVFFTRWPASVFITLEWTTPTTLLTANHAETVGPSWWVRKNTLLLDATGPRDAFRLMLHVQGTHPTTPFIKCDAPKDPPPLPLTPPLPPSPPCPGAPPSPFRPPSSPPKLPSPTPSAPPGVRMGKRPTSTQLPPVRALLSSEGSNSPASNCIDGRTNATTKSELCASSPRSYSPWLSVQIGPGSVVGEVAVYNRGDGCCENEISPFVVWLASTPGIPDELEICGDEFSVPSSPGPYTVDCEGAQGEFVTIMLPGDARSLALAELQIFGLYSPPAFPPPEMPPMSPLPPYPPPPLSPPPLPCSPPLLPPRSPPPSIPLPPSSPPSRPLFSPPPEAPAPPFIA
ncbi:MAG: hypothetical protein SGPRY_006793 [Prymnesium sp.]